MTLEDYTVYSLHLCRKLLAHEEAIRDTRFLYLLFFLGQGVVVHFIPDSVLPPTFLVTLRITVTAIGVVGGVGLFLAYPGIYWGRIERANRVLVAALGRPAKHAVELTLTEELFVEDSRSVRSEVRWQDMKGIEVVGDCTYIAVTETLVAVIPRHGFERDHDYFAVREFALRKLGIEKPPAVAS